MAEEIRALNLDNIIISNSRVTINYDGGKSSDYSITEYKKVSIDFLPTLLIKNLILTTIKETNSSSGSSNSGSSGSGSGSGSSSESGSGGNEIISYTKLGYSNPSLEVSKTIVLTGGNSLQGDKLYSIGLLSDIHSCVENDNYDDPSNKPEENWQDEDDLKQALTNFKNEGVKNIFACGDAMEHWRNHHPEDIEGDSNDFARIFSEFHSNGLRLFTPTGNHDNYALYETRSGDAGKITKDSNEVGINGYNSGVKERIDTYWNRIQGESVTGTNSNTDNFEENSEGEELRYFAYNAYKTLHQNYVQSDSLIDNWEEVKDNLSGWNNPSAGKKNSYSKLSYWMEKDNTIFICLSIDYGNDKWNCNVGWNDRMIRARQIITNTNTDPYIKRLFEYAKLNEGYTDDDIPYNYQFYHPNALIWLKEIIESNQGKKIFVFSHHFLPHKVGNNSVSNLPKDGGWSYERVYPYDFKENDSYDSLNQKAKGSNALCGVEYWFIRNLTINHKNVIWFSGHSHISWTLGIDSHITNKDYSIVNPNKTDYLTYYHGKSDSEISESAWYKKVYTRSGNKGSSYDTAWWVALPSLSKPKHVTGSDENTIYPDAEYAIMDVYANGVEIKGYKMTRVEETVTESSSSYNSVNGAGKGPSSFGLQDYTDGTAGEGIKLVLHNKVGTDIVFSGKLKLYVTKGDTNDWSNTSIDDLFEAHICEPDDTSNGRPYWTKNKYRLGPNESKTIIVNKIVRYIGDGNTVSKVEWPLSKLVEENYSFMTTDNGPGWPEIYAPAIKLGHVSKTTEGDNPYLLHVEPIVPAAAKITIGRTYNLVINGALYEDEEWNWGSYSPSSIISTDDTLGTYAVDNGTNDVRIILYNNTGRDICFNGKLKFRVANTASDASVNFKYGDPNYRDDAGNIDSEDAKLSEALDTIDAALCSYDTPVEVYENGMNITSNANKTGHYVLNHYALKAGDGMEVVLNKTEAAKAIGKYFMAVEGNQGYMYTAGGSKPIGGGGIPSNCLATTIQSGKQDEYYRYKDIKYYTTNYAFMYLIKPVTNNGKPVQIERGKSYIFNIYSIFEHYPMNWNVDNPSYQITYGSLPSYVNISDITGGTSSSSNSSSSSSPSSSSNSSPSSNSSSSSSDEGKVKHNLGPVYFNIKLNNKSNKTIYVVGRIKLFVTKVINGANIYGMLYPQPKNFKSYASMSIAAGSSIFLGYSTLEYDPSDGGMKDATNIRSDGGWRELQKPAEYVNGGVISAAELNIYTYYNKDGNKIWSNNKLKGTLVNHTDMIFDAGSASNIGLYEINITENPEVPYDYWTTP